MPFNQLPNGLRVNFRRGKNWVWGVISRAGQSLRVKVFLFEYLFPIQLRQDFAEVPRHQSYIKKFLKENYGEEAKHHEPSRLDMLMYGVSVLSRAVLKFCSTWIIIQFIFAVLKMSDYPRAFIIPLIVVDMIILLFLIVVAVANVSLYGPTSACFVIAFRLKEPTGANYRLALNSYPRTAETKEVQLKRWRYTRIYVKLIARTEAREKLINIVIALFTVILCISVISYLLTSTKVNLPLIQYNDSPVNMLDGIWKHLHFYLVTLATIGYGDMTFVNTTLGHIVGAFMSIMVIASVLGFVSYISYYIINFRDRIFAGLDLEADSGADWIAQGLKDI
jgi:hypothetical protein